MTAGASNASRGCAFCHLRAELDEANERIKWLEAMIHPPADISYAGLRLSRSEKIILEALYALRRVSNDNLCGRLDLELRRDIGKRAIDVFVHRLRRKLAELQPPLQIATIWGQGYAIDAPTQARLKELRSAE